MLRLLGSEDCVERALTVIASATTYFLIER